VVEHGVAAATVLGEPCGAGEAGVLIAWLRFSVAGSAEGALGSVVVERSARWPPAVLVDLVRDGVACDLWLVVGLAETSPDLGGESSLHVRVARGQTPPVQ
jgi:hypothetical protein